MASKASKARKARVRREAARRPVAVKSGPQRSGSWRPLMIAGAR